MKTFKNFGDVEKSIIVKKDYGDLKGKEFDFPIKAPELLDYIKKHGLSKIDFTGSDFKGKIECGRHDNGKVSPDFKDCELVFSKCIFYDTVIFNDSIFDKVRFDRALFKETASFIKTEFNDNIVDGEENIYTFFHTEFAGVALFRCASARCRETDNAKHGTLIFQETKFEKTAQFDEIEVERLIFRDCKASMGLEFKNHEKDPKNASETKIKANEESSKKESKPKSKKQKKGQKTESELKFKALSFENSLIGDNTDLDWEEDNVLELLQKGNQSQGGASGKTDKRAPSSSLVKQLGVLKQIYNNQGDYSTEDKVFVALMKEKKRIGKVGKKIIYGIGELISNYGTSYGRILVTALLSVILFGAIYLLVGMLTSTEILESLSYALTGFFTPITCKNIAVTIISSAECFLGLFLMALLAAVVARKIIR